MQLTHLQHAGGSNHLGFAGNRFTAVVGPDGREAEAVWPGEASAQGANAAINPNVGIFAKAHTIFPTEFKHASLRIVPRRPTDWSRRRPALFLDNQGHEIRDAQQNPYFTIGAGPGADDTSLLCTDTTILVSDRNRPLDVESAPSSLEKLQYPPILENDLIQRLLTFDENYRDDLRYCAVPEAASSNFYNSNSYISGILRATDIPQPRFPHDEPVSYPGWSRPVPVSEFLFHP
jgi:hypothetical protein